MTNYKTDIEIAQECEMKDIASVAERIGIGEESLKRYGNHIAKINLEAKLQPLLGSPMHCLRLAKRQLVLFVNLRSVLFLALKAELLVAVMLKLSQWKT